MGKKKHNEEYHDFYCSQNIYRVIRTRRITWAGRLASMREMRNTGRVLVGKPEGNRLLGRPRLDGKICCGKRLQFCHGYSKASYFFFADSVCELCVGQRHLAQMSFNHLHCARLNSIRTLRADGCVVLLLKGLEVSSGHSSPSKGESDFYNSF